MEIGIVRYLVGKEKRQKSVAKETYRVEFPAVPNVGNSIVLNGENKTVVSVRYFPWGDKYEVEIVII